MPIEIHDIRPYSDAMISSFNIIIDTNNTESIELIHKFGGTVSFTNINPSVARAIADQLASRSMPMRFGDIADIINYHIDSRNTIINNITGLETLNEHDAAIVKSVRRTLFNDSIW